MLPLRTVDLTSFVLVLTLVGCGGGEPAASPAPPPPALSAPTGTLLLVSERSGAPEVWAVAPDGSKEQRVAGEPGAAFPAAADPRGTHALVVSVEDSEETGHRETMWLVSLDGADRRQVAPPAGKVRNPAWAPDGSWLAFEADAESYRDLYRVDRDGSAPTRLTDAEHGSFEPAISPNGERVLFGTSRDGNAEIYVMDADGGNQTRLTDTTADDIQPGWSPSGRTISWISDREGARRVWLMDEDGRNPRPLRPLGEDRAVDHTYAWSPDGSRIAVAVQTGNRQIDIHVVDAVTGQRLALLGEKGVDEHPAWSPDGRWIAFSSSRGGDTDVYVASADGAETRRVTTSVGPDWLPRWVASDR